MSATPVIEFAHANGFPAKVYSTLFSALQPYTVHYVPRLGHDDHYPHRHWTPMVHQVLDAMAQRTLPKEGCVGLGHSLGAVILLYAYLRKPQYFSHLILMDPPLCHWRKGLTIRLLRACGLAEQAIEPLRATKHRRERWASAQEAATQLRSKALFKHLSPQAFEDYITHNLVAVPEGVRLFFEKDIELQIYRTTPAFLPRTYRIAIPSYCIYSAHFKRNSKEDVQYLQKRLPHTLFIPFDGGHMFPLEKPELSATLIKHLLYTKKKAL